MIPTLQLGAMGRRWNQAAGGGGGGAPFFSSDGSSLTGWTVSGATVDAAIGNPLPCIRCGTNQYAHRLFTGARRWKLDMRTGPMGLCDFQFGCNSSGVGPMIRLDVRGSPHNSGIGTSSGWSTFATAPSGGSSLGTGYVANTWYTFDIQLNGAGTAVDVLVNGLLVLSAVPVTINGDYAAYAGDGLGGGIFDNLDIYA